MTFDDILGMMTAFTRESPLNVVPDLNDLQIYDLPLVGVAAADDPLFGRLKEEDAVGPQHMSPQEWLPGSKAVISYFLPFTARVRKANREAGWPAEEWLYARIEGQLFNNALAKLLIAKLTEAGYQAIAPSLDPRFTVVNRKSNWSERHVAFIAGVGTFCLNRSLITKSGSAGRLGSVVVNMELAATPRYYEAIDENCSKCGACIPRCPPRAVTPEGKDNAVCAIFLDETKARFNPRYGCGKCQTAVPCEDRIPAKKVLS